MLETPFGASISKPDFFNNKSTTSLPLSPPLSNSQTPHTSSPTFSNDSNSQKQKDFVNGMQEKQSSFPESKPPPSPTSPANIAPISRPGSGASLSVPVPNAWKVGRPLSHPNLPQSSESGHSSNEGPEGDTNERGVNDIHNLGTPGSNHSDGYEEFQLELTSDDGCIEGPRLIQIRRSSEGAAFHSQNQSHYSRDAGHATGNASSQNFLLNPPGALGQRRGSDIGSTTSLGMGTSPNPPTKWGSLGFQWTAGPSIWNGNGNGTGRSKSVVGGTPTTPLDEAPVTRSVSFSQHVGIESESRSPIGTGPSMARSPTIGVGYFGDEYDQEQQPQLRQARSLSFALGQQETDFFGKGARPQTSNSSSIQTNLLAASRRNSAMAHSFDDSELFRSTPRYGQEHHAPSSASSSSLRGLENAYHQSLPSMSEELEGPHGAHHVFDSLDDHPDKSSMSPSEASYAAFTLPKLRTRNKSSYAAFTTASSHNSSSANSPISRVRAPAGYNSLSPQQHPMYNSATAPSSLSSSPYRHSKSLGVLPGLPMTSTADDSVSAPVYASIWRDGSTSADVSQQNSSSIHLHDGLNNQRRRSITMPNECWPKNSPQQPGRLSISMNGSGNGSDNYTSQGGESSSPELLETVRSHRRLSLNPAVGGGMGTAHGGMGGMMGLRNDFSVNNIGMGSTGNYGEYRYMESGQGLGMMNRSVEPEYAHLNQRRHSVAGPTLSFGNSSQSRHPANALDALQLDDNSIYGNQQHHGFGGTVEESSLDDYFDNDERRAARVAAATASGNYGGISSNANGVAAGLGNRSAATVLGHSASRDADAHLGKGVPLHAVPHHGPLFIVEFKAGRSDLFYLVLESPSQQVKKGDLVIVEADRGKDLGKVVNDNITPVQVQMLQQQQAEAAAVAEMGISSLVGPGSSILVKELHSKRIYRLAQPAEVTMLVTKSQDEAKAMLLCQTKVCQKNLPMEVVDAEYQWDRRKLTFYFIAERRIDFRELVRELFKIYKTRIWMCAVNPNVSSGLGMSALRK